jgi:hypothetical protein
MNAEKFIESLSEHTGLDENQARTVNEIIETTYMVGNKSKNFIIQQISQKLGVSEEIADMIYNVAIGIIASIVLKRINPFRR